MKSFGPPSAKDREEARRNRVLENAAREARERKQNSRPTTGTSPPATDDTAKLLDDQSPREEGAETPKGLEGMSINDILKMKSKDGPRKPRKIVASWFLGIRRRTAEFTSFSFSFAMHSISHQLAANYLF